VYKYQVSLNNGGGIVTPTAITGYDAVYFFTSLRSKFPASAFQDANGNQTTPGLFDIQYLYSNIPDNTLIDSCSIALGTQGIK